MLQLVCPTLAPRVGPRLAVSGPAPGLPAREEGRLHLGTPFPAGEGTKARGPHPLLCPKPANLTAFLSPAPGRVAQSLRGPTPVCTHPCQSHCDPIPPSPTQWQRECIPEPDHLGSSPCSTTNRLCAMQVSELCSSVSLPQVWRVSTVPVRPLGSDSGACA